MNPSAVVELSPPPRGAASAPATDGASRYEHLGTIAAVVMLTLTCLGLLVLLSPRLLMSPTLVTGGALGVHVYPLHEFVDRLLPSGTMSGWTQGWFGGLPLYTFYFPLPAVLVAVGTPVLGFEVAVKWMVALGPLTVPFAAYAFLRSMGLSRWTATSGAVVGASYVLMLSFNNLGGNLLSTFLGEFSYSISFSLSLLYLAVVLSSGRRNVNGTLAAATLLALVALSHVLTTGAVVVCTLFLLSKPSYQRTIVGSWWLGFLFAAFWALPFLARLGYGSGPSWAMEPRLAQVLPTELVLFLPLALVGGIWVARRYRRAAIPLLFMPVLAVAFYLLPQTAIHRARLLPFGFFAVHALAGIAVGALLEHFAAKRSRWALAAATAGILFIVGVNALRNTTVARNVVQASLAGYESAEGWAEYQDLVGRVSDLPPGRVFWEESDYTSRYGTSMALQLLPYWSPDHPVLAGLWSESSATYPYALRLSHELGDTAVTAGITHLDVSGTFDFERGMDHARILGGRYFIAFSDRARELSRQRADMQVVVDEEPWSVFELSDVSLVEALDREPVVLTGGDFDAVAGLWFDSLYTDGTLITRQGPSGWQRVGDSVATQEMETRELPAARGAGVSEVTVDDHSIAFRTSAVGVPHLVRVSYFPNWLAIGADGPFRAAPNFMVVVPREEEVRLEFVDSNVEWGGRALTLLGLICSLFVVARPARSGPLQHRA